MAHVAHVQSDHAQAADVDKEPRTKAHPIENLYMHTYQRLKCTAWSSTCSSCFKNGEKHGPVTAIGPGSQLHYFEVLKELRYEKFDIKHCGGKSAYMGNGYTRVELEVKENALWYLDILKRELEASKDGFLSLAD